MPDAGLTTVVIVWNQEYGILPSFVIGSTPYSQYHEIAATVTLTTYQYYSAGL